MDAQFTTEYSEGTESMEQKREESISIQKLTSLLNQGMETDNLDYKRQCDINDAHEFVELVKDIAAMMVKGGFIIVGANDDGTPSEYIDESTFSDFDCEKLTSKVQRFIDGPFELESKVFSLEDHNYLVIHVRPHTHGFAIFKKDGQGKSGKQVFRAGDIFIRHDTKSERCHQADIILIQKQIVRNLQEDWMTESTTHFNQILSTQLLTSAANTGPQLLAWDVDSQTFESVFQQLLIQGNYASIRLVLIKARSMVAQSLTSQNPLVDHKLVLNRLVSMGALAAQLAETGVFQEVIETLHKIYELPIKSDGISIKWSTPTTHGLWEDLVVHLFGLGGLLVRLERWELLSSIFDKRVQGEDGQRYGNWLRHGITMAARSRPYIHNGNSPDKQEFNPISSALSLISRTEALHPESFDDEDLWLSSLCQFDFLNCIHRDLHDGKAVGASYYPSFASFRSSRTEPVAVRLVTDPELRERITPVPSERLADALTSVNELAERMSSRINGWGGYYDPSIRTLISSKHFPEQRHR